MRGDGAEGRLQAAELAAIAGTTDERVAILASHGVIRPGPDGSFTTGDVHRLRLVEAFEAAGVPFQALLAGATTGDVDFTRYHELHRAPGPPSRRSYGDVRQSLDPAGTVLPELYAAFGCPEPDPGTRLPAEDESILERWLGILDGIADRDLAVRVVRIAGESTRRAMTATLDVYEEAAASLGPGPTAIPPDDYDRLLTPWTRLARELPELVGWLSERHLRTAIDGFSVETAEQLLAAAGHVPIRDTVMPGIAFVDLTGFTAATQTLGDETAARLSLRLGDLARAVVAPLGGRLVKLLGDGALLQMPDGRSAVAASVELLTAIGAAGLPGGHVGVHQGPVIEREGDVFGRTVNLAARISDIAPDGAIYVTTDVAAGLDGSAFATTPVGRFALPGIGSIELHAVGTGSLSPRRSEPPR